MKQLDKISLMASMCGPNDPNWSLIFGLSFQEREKKKEVVAQLAVKNRNMNTMRSILPVVIKKILKTNDDNFEIYWNTLVQDSIHMKIKVQVFYKNSIHNISINNEDL